MLMSDEEVEARLNSEDNLVKVIQRSRGGNTVGSTRIPAPVRDLIAITANTSGETQQEIAEEFGIDGSSVSEISRGLVGGRLDKKLQSIGTDARETQENDAHEAAMAVLMTTLTTLQPKIINPDLTAKDLSKIASDMSKVASNLKPKEAGTVNNTQVILYAPPRKTLKQYDIIEA